MGRVMCVANVKGGVGKTALAVNFAVEAWRAGKKVLLLDTDPQGTAVDFAAARPEAQWSTTQMTRPVIHREVPGFSRDYELVVIDAGGKDGETFRSALGAADDVVIPVRPGGFEMWGTDQGLAVVREVAQAREESGRPPLRWAVVLNMVKVRKLALEGLAQFEEDEVPVLKTWLWDRVDWTRASGDGLGVAEHRPKGKGAEELCALLDELNLPRPRSFKVVAGGKP